MKNMQHNSLLDRVVLILEQARANVVRVVNSSMVTAYWLIGREIVLELQGGDERAEYGKQVIENLSERLTQRYGKGFSAPTLWKFRQFYQAYSSREPTILSPAGRDSTPQSLDSDRGAILSPMGIESATTERSYVRMFDDLYTATDDNPTIGLILCAEKNEAVAKYSVLNDRKQIFASRYMLYLPTEKELALELERERRLIEAHLAEQEQLTLSDVNDNINAE